MLQAYLPDSYGRARELGAWAAARHRRAGGRIKVRIVKGANLAMESAEAEMHGWAPAPFPTRPRSTPTTRRCSTLLLAPEFDDAVRIGVASHNLFDVAWALGDAA